MEHAIVLPGGGLTIDEIVEIGRRAEDRGLAAVYCVEVYRSAMVPLAAIANATERVRLGPYILNACGRTPLMTAMSAVDFDEMCGGRLVLCLGVGNRHFNEDQQGVTVERPARRMAEYTELVRRMVRARPGDQIAFAGEMYHVRSWSPAVAPVRPSIPVHLAAIYPAMRRVAGRVADGIALGTMVSPEYLRDVIRPAVSEAAERAGRDRAEVRVLMAAFVSPDEDRERARLAARQAICGLFSPLPHPYYEFLMREQGFGDVADAAVEHVSAGRPERAIERMSDEFVDALTVAGTLEECRRSLARYHGLVDEVVYVNARGPIAGDPSPMVASWSKVMDCAPAA